MTFRALVAIPVLAILALSACTAAPPAAPEVEPVSALDTCIQVSDIKTLVYNSGMSFAEGRMNEQEVEGARNLAFSMVTFVEVDPDSALASPIARLKAVPAEGIRVVYGPQASSLDDSSSDEWDAIFEELTTECKDLGGAYGVMGWTGG